MERRIDYETLDKGWGDCNIYVRRTFTIDVPNTATLFKIIDVLWEWYEDLRLRRIERFNYDISSIKAPKTKTWKWKWSTITIDEDGFPIWDTWVYHNA